MMKEQSFLGLDPLNGSGSHTLVFGPSVFHFRQSASLIRPLIASASCAKGSKASGMLLRSSLGLLSQVFCSVLDVQYFQRSHRKNHQDHHYYHCH